MVLVIIEQFTKSSKLVPMLKLPLAADTARAILEHMVRAHGIPAIMVSDCGPQFLSPLDGDHDEPNLQISSRN